MLVHGAVIALCGIVLVSCGGDRISDQRDYLENLGYPDVKLVHGDERPYLFSSTLNDCTIHLFRTMDKEIWVAAVVQSPSGKHGVVDPNRSVGSAKKLKENPAFLKYCP